MSEFNLTPNSENYPSLDYFAGPVQGNQPANSPMTPMPNQNFAVGFGRPVPNPNLPPYYGFNPAAPHPTNAQPVISPDGYAAPGQPLFTPYGYGYTYPSMYAFPSPTFTDVVSAPKARFGPRLVALIIDTLMVYGFVIFFQISTLIAMGIFLSRYYMLETWFYFIAQAILIIGLGAFDTIMLGRKGQTIGYKSACIQFVNAKGQRPGYWRAFFRWLLLSISFSMAFSGAIYLIYWLGKQLNPYSYSYYYYSNSRSSSGLELFFALLSLAAVAFFLIARLWFLWDSNKQTLFDKIVGLYALNVNPFHY